MNDSNKHNTTDNSELKNLSPLLFRMRNNHPFQAPDEKYFDEFALKVQNRISEQKKQRPNLIALFIRQLTLVKQPVLAFATIVVLVVFIQILTNPLQDSKMKEYTYQSNYEWIDEISEDLIVDVIKSEGKNSNQEYNYLLEHIDEQLLKEI